MYTLTPHTNAIDICPPTGLFTDKNTLNLSWIIVQISYHTLIIYPNYLKETLPQKLGEEYYPVT